MADQKFVATNGETWGHKWGFRDSEFILHKDRTITLSGERYDLCGMVMPDFIPYVEESLQIKVDPDDVLPEVEHKPVPQPQINPDFLSAVESTFPPDRYSVDSVDRLLHSHGQTTSEEVYKILYGQIDKAIDMVFYAESDEEVIELIRLAEDHDICLVPFGGGTSVSSALKLPKSENRMIVAIDTRRMDKIEWVNTEDGRACVQAGITGSKLEEELRNQGYMVGHEPDSIEFSTLGGWIATQASGMKKNRYGNIEDIVENITVITPRGILEQNQATTRVSMGMRPQNLLFGSEGNLGLITRAVIKIHKLPEVQEYASAVFPSWQKGVDFLQALSRTNYIPASVRLVDNIQFRFGQALKPHPEGFKKLMLRLQKLFVTQVKGFDPYQMCAVTFVMEGASKEVAYQKQNILELSKQHQGLPAGPENGKRGYMLTFAIAYIRDFLSNYHIIGETMETSVPWSKIRQVCQKTKDKLFELHEEHNIPGQPYLSYRIPQIYHTGVCIYFMFGMYMKGIKDPEVVFGSIEHAMRKEIMNNGGSISHHHGVGKLRKDFLPDTMSPASIELIRQLKASHDPNNVFGIRNNVLAD